MEKKHARKIEVSFVWDHESGCYPIEAKVECWVGKDGFPRAEVEEMDGLVDQDGGELCKLQNIADEKAVCRAIDLYEQVLLTEGLIDKPF